MKILAVDTATVSCSVAVTEAGRLRAEITQATGETHAKHLMFMVDTALALAGMSVNDMDGFAAVTGPGTFTGLRIGLSSVQGLAQAVAKPVAGIVSLDALCAQAVPVAGDRGLLICALLDARRKEVYYRFYRTDAKGAAPVSAPLVGPPETLAAGIDEPCMMVGNGIVKYGTRFKELLGERLMAAPALANTIRGETVAGLARVAFEGGAACSAGVLQPLYLRKSDAEVNAARVV